MKQILDLIYKWETTSDVYTSDEVYMLEKCASELKALIKDTMTVYIAWTNSDLTEGKGTEYPLAICESV
jgi:hypothetical protein